jgi:hypothetical protein
VAQGDASHAAGQADQRALRQQPGKEAAPRQTDGAQKGELGAPPHHRQRLRREDQEAAGQQGDGRQHRQVDAVGARQVGRLIGRRRRRVDQQAGGQDGLQRRAGRGGRHAFGQFQVDAGEPPDLAEPGLHGGDIHQREAAMAGRAGNVSGNPQVRRPAARVQRDALAGLQFQRFLQRGAEEDGVVGQCGEAPCPGGRSGQQRRGHPGQREDIGAEQLQGFFRTRSPDLQFH